MKLTVTIDRDEDGAWIVECPSIPGCVSQGTTIDEALDNIKDAIKLCLEVLRAAGGCRSRASIRPRSAIVSTFSARHVDWKDRDDLPGAGAVT